ncbi:hypothetical protein AYO44_17065 [Planctomycetaceae bacterium SCGC AG-212-F19]|nr:hypothetical protein AYO44_17065 [Planctomycetaceae bacterium SCGC AG-212-F19]
MSRPESQDELQALCEAIVENRLTAEERQRLETLVTGDANARRFYVEYLHQHACLSWTAAQPELSQSGMRNAECGVAATPQAAIPVSGRGVWRRRLAFVGALAAGVLLAVGGWQLFGPARAASGELATLVSGMGCKWDGGTLPTEEGARLGPGRLRLAEGITRIVFDNGAELTLEAPADLELVTGQRCVLRAGRLVANVPPRAIGFVVDTPTAQFRDLGTEFGVNVRDEQTADLQVFSGLVDAKLRSTGAIERLQTGQNRRFGAEQVITIDPQGEVPAPVSPPTPAPAAQTRVVQISTAMGRGKDAYVQPLFPSPNSSDILLLVKNMSAGKADYNRKAYLGIDLASVAGMKVIDAQLTFTFTPTGMGFGSRLPDATFAVYGLTDESADDWDERTLRWAHAPANEPGGAALDPAKVVLLGKFVIPQGAVLGTKSIAGAELVDFLNRDTNQIATFILVRETIGNGPRADLVHGFANKKHPTLPPPTLRLTVEPK